MITFSEATRAVFFADFGVADWLLVVEATSDGALVIFRCRKINDEKIFDSADEKEWWDCKIGTVEEAIERSRALFRDASNALNGQVWELIRGTATFDDFFQEFLKLPFAHAKTLEAAP